jgi:hypothetical protein
MHGSEGGEKEFFPTPINRRFLVRQVKSGSLGEEDLTPP